MISLHRLLPIASLALLSPVQAAFAGGTSRVQEENDQEEADEAGDDVPVERIAEGELRDPVAAARRLAETLETETYGIYRWSKKDDEEERIGTYVQINRIVEIDGDEMLELSDVVKMPRAGREYEARTVCELEPELPVKFLNVQVGPDQLQLVVTRNGISGMSFMQVPINMEIDGPFLTETSLLRGLPRVPDAEGNTDTFAYLDVENLNQQQEVSSGVLSCTGRDDVEIDGETVSAWKYRWKAKGKRPKFLWYDDDGRLLQRRYRREIWRLLPSE